MTLNELSKLTEDEARSMLERIRWPDGPVCGHCGAMDNIRKMQGKAHRKGLYKCNDCEGQFTVTINSVMEGSHITIRQWLMAFALVCSAKKGVSALQLQRQLGLGSYRTAWHLAHRIRHAMTQEPLAGLLRGDVEVDETYVGGKARNPHARQRGRGTKKVPVMVLVERDGRSVAMPISSASAKVMDPIIRKHVDPSSRLMTDEWQSYKSVGREFKGGHHRVKHARGEYVRGEAHVNTAESWNSLLKRGIMGSFHHVSEQHLHRYCNEFTFRWNHRKAKDGERTAAAIKASEGKRLMYRQPTSKT